MGMGLHWTTRAGALASSIGNLDIKRPYACLAVDLALDKDCLMKYLKHRSEPYEES